MRMVGSPANKPDDKWRENEYQSLIKHFEEIYRLSATSLTVLVAACGAVFAYGGVTAINGGIVCVLIVLWYFAWVKNIRSYTLNVLGRLAVLEDETKHRGHFFDWREKVAKDKHGIERTGTFAWEIVVGLASAGAILFFVAAGLGYNSLPPPIEASVQAKTAHGDIQFKAILRDHEFKDGAVKLLQRARELGAVTPAVAPSPAPAPLPAPTPEKVPIPEKQR